MSCQHKPKCSDRLTLHVQPPNATAKMIKSSFQPLVASNHPSHLHTSVTSKTTITNSESSHVVYRTTTKIIQFSTKMCKQRGKYLNKCKYSEGIEKKNESELSKRHNSHTQIWYETLWVFTPQLIFHNLCNIDLILAYIKPKITKRF